jgi:eukaryotic-like serine/threonine-protein kinase
LLVAHDAPGAAAVLAAGAVVPPLIVVVAAAVVRRPTVRGTGRAWSLPAAAPLIGLVTLAAAYPAIAGRARTALQRAALGATGVWWLILGEALLGRDLLFGTEPPPGWRQDAEVAVTEVLGPPFATGLLAVAAVWALAALLLPWLVRGRRLGPDVVGASAWAAGLGSGTAAVAEWAGAQAPYGLTGGAIVAGVLAFLGPRLLPRDIVDP